MSPRISPVPAMQPSLLPTGFPADGGITSATGLPNRVTQIGFRVFRTCSRMPRHLALNSEIAISFIINLYHGQRLWSKLLRTAGAFRSQISSWYGTADCLMDEGAWLRHPAPRSV